MRAYKYGDALNVKKTAENLRRIRKANGDTQIELSRKLGCSQSYFSKIEQAQAIMTLEMAVRICALYGISMDQLIIINEESLPELRIIVD